MNWLQNFIARLFRIEPARDRVITIREAHTFRENVIQNKLWYLGDGVTLEQYFKKTAKWDVEKARFWAATAQGNVRKIHSGIVGTVVDRYKDIVLADLDAVDFGENMDILEERWNEIFEGSKLNDVIGDAIVGALSSGDGALRSRRMSAALTLLWNFTMQRMWNMYISIRRCGKSSSTQPTEIGTKITGCRKPMDMAM